MHENPQYGAINVFIDHKHIMNYSACFCDYQYAETSRCREDIHGMNFFRGSYVINRNHINKLCPPIPIINQNFEFIYTSTLEIKDINNLQHHTILNKHYDYHCDDKRPYLFYMSGFHMSKIRQNGGFFDNTFYLKYYPCLQWLNETMDQFYSQCGYWKAFIIIISGGTTQRRDKDNQYRHQRRENQQFVTNKYKSLFRRWYPNIIYVDFMKLTSAGDYSDGVHYYTSTNLQMVNVVLQLAYLAMKEQRILYQVN